MFQKGFLFNHARYSDQQIREHKGSRGSMKLNTRARYGLQAMIQIARNSGEGKPVNLNLIAVGASVSRRYLEQLVIPLKNASLIKGLSGKDGGYVLAKPAGQIRVGDIIEATIGPINIVECVRVPDSCKMADSCECRPLYVSLNEKITEALNTITLADLTLQRRGLTREASLRTDVPDRVKSRCASVLGIGFEGARRFQKRDRNECFPDQGTTSQSFGRRLKLSTQSSSSPIPNG
jgi:Rrf2 family protein